MYAIVEINGQQFKVEQGMKLYVHHIKDVEAGKTVEFDKVLLVDKEGAVTVGAPTVEGAKVVVEEVNPLVKGQGHRFQDETPQRLSQEEWSSRSVHASRS